VSKSVESTVEIDMEKVTVTNPRLTLQNNICYSFSGFDNKGYFKDIEKRYSETYEFYKWIRENYWGLCIPIFPPKKIIGNKDAAFIEERRQMLE
jgi:hypothetical protein